MAGMGVLPASWMLPEIFLTGDWAKDNIDRKSAANNIVDLCIRIRCICKTNVIFIEMLYLNISIGRILWAAGLVCFRYNGCLIIIQGIGLLFRMQGCREPGFDGENVIKPGKYVMGYLCV